jgi:hypothetical protein
MALGSCFHIQIDSMRRFARHQVSGRLATRETALFGLTSDRD